MITVCDAAHEELAAAGSAAARDRPGRLHWSIPDPARTGDDRAFDRVVTDLTDRIARVAPAPAAPARCPTVRPAHRPHEATGRNTR